MPAPDAPPSGEPADEPASPVSKCSKAAFAAVSTAPSPAPAVVQAALHDLRVCHEAGEISDVDFDRYTTGLINKLVNKP